MQALLGCAARGGTRRDSVMECLASCDRRRALCRQHRGTDAGAAGLDQRGAAGDDRLAAARRTQARCRARARRLGRASARYREHPADREPRVLPADGAKLSMRLHGSSSLPCDRASAWRCRHPRSRRPRPVEAAASSVCRRPCLGSSLFLPIPPMMSLLFGLNRFGRSPVVLRIDLNLTAFDGYISRSWTIFPAFFRRSV